MSEFKSSLPLSVPFQADDVPAAVHHERDEPPLAQPANAAGSSANVFIAGSRDDLSHSLHNALRARGVRCCIADVIHDVEQNFLVEELFDAMTAKLTYSDAILAVP